MRTACLHTVESNVTFFDATAFDLGLQSRLTEPWNAAAKDDLEARLHELVCWGGLDLRAAQAAIRTDWIAAYQRYLGPLPLPLPRARPHQRR